MKVLPSGGCVVCDTNDVSVGGHVLPCSHRCAQALARVKLQFLGFSGPATAASIADDLHALGYVLLEVLLSCVFADEDFPEPPAADQDTLKRLYDDLFDRDVLRLRDYCDAEPAWAPAVALLDADGSGEVSFQEFFAFGRALERAPAFLSRASRLHGE